MIARALTDGGTELVLQMRRGVFTLRADGRELMSSRSHCSEELLATAVCGAIEPRSEPRVLIGGLGMGFTLRAALDALPAGAQVVVAEVVAAVVDWCRGPLSQLSKRALDDPRVEARVADVAQLLREQERAYDAILLDVDNGPGDLSLTHNRRLYAASGLRDLASALRAGGAAGVWSAAPDPGFPERLHQAGFEVRTLAATPHAGVAGISHTIYLGRLGPSGRR